MSVNCDFCITQNYFGSSKSETYFCFIKDQEILSNNNLKFQGEHKLGRTNVDVKGLQIGECKMQQLPYCFAETFKNIEILHIIRSNLKSLTKIDLKQFENLKKIDLYENDIEFLPGDLFEYTKKIEEIYFPSNKIKFIGPNIFDGIENLKNVNLSNNANISCWYAPGNIKTITIEQLKLKIKINCKPPMDEREMLKKYGRDPDEVNPKIKQIPVKKASHNFQDDLKELLNLEKFKDFTIKVADRDFKVHKLIFAARSQTFAELIENNPDAEDLVLQDIPVEVFESILSFVYTDELPENENIHDVFAAAGTLKINGLLEVTAQILTTKIKNEKNLEILFKIICLAHKFNCDELKLNTLEEIKKHFPGRNIKDELADQLDKLKSLISAKLLLERQFEDLDI